jgi:hypothetical protein
MSDGPKAHRTNTYELGADEIGHYIAAVATDEHSGGEEFVSRLILEGTMELWVYNHEGTILVATTRIVDYPDGYRELMVQGMSGTKVTSTLSHKVIHRDMMEFAVREGCFRMVAFVKPEIWEHFSGQLKTEGYREDYVVISLGPDDVNDRCEFDGE